MGLLGIIRKLLGLKQPCAHKFVEHDKQEMLIRGKRQGVIYVMRCSDCGRMKNHVLNINDYFPY